MHQEGNQLHLTTSLEFIVEGVAESNLAVGTNIVTIAVVDNGVEGIVNLCCWQYLFCSGISDAVTIVSGHLDGMNALGTFSDSQQRLVSQEICN